MGSNLDLMQVVLSKNKVTIAKLVLELVVIGCVGCYEVFLAIDFRILVRDTKVFRSFDFLLGAR